MPNGFNDLRCECGNRIGWSGGLKDIPACSRCGARPSTEEMQAIEDKIDIERQKILAELENKGR